MRLVTWIASDGARRPGAVSNIGGVDRLVDLTPLAVDIVTILSDEVIRAAAQAALASAGVTAPLLADVPLGPPVVPGKLLCLGYNYAGHVAAGASVDDVPQYPNVFVKTPNTYAGPNDPVVLPAASAHTDYEGEIALVVGSQARNVAEAAAGTHIAGYLLLNDVSSRDWQDRSSQWTLGKCSDGFAPMGPWITTADAVPNPGDLLLEVVRDGEVTVSQSTATCVFTPEFTLAYISQMMTLEPGDVISLGTPQKLPSALAAHRPLAPGDAVTVRATGLGELTTTFLGSR